MDKMKLVTNMPEGKLFDTFVDFRIQCQNCKRFHIDHDIVPSCDDCETKLWIDTLSDHFGIKLTVG